MKEKIVEGYNEEKRLLTERLITITDGNQGYINETSPTILNRLKEIDTILAQIAQTPL